MTNPKDGDEELPGRHAIHRNLAELLPDSDPLFSGDPSTRVQTASVKPVGPMKLRSGRDPILG